MKIHLFNFNNCVVFYFNLETYIYLENSNLSKSIDEENFLNIIIKNLSTSSLLIVDFYNNSYQVHLWAPKRGPTSN